MSNAIRISNAEAKELGDKIKDLDGRKLSEILGEDEPRPQKAAPTATVNRPKRKRPTRIDSIAFRNFSVALPHEDTQNFMFELDQLFHKYCFNYVHNLDWNIEDSMEL